MSSSRRAACSSSAVSHPTGTHYNLLEQDIGERRFLLWGFQEGPGLMTDDGRHLFINVARRLAGM